MDSKNLARSAAACVLAAALLSPTASAASAKSSDVISAALEEVGYTEGDGEYSKYGAWYGLPHSYWCDMFASWCAMKANIPTSKFPRHCSCTTHVNLFAKMGCYQNSAARGGSYIPQQGDEIFFYNYCRYPSGSVKNHTGLVLYVEDGYVYTVEGNALANRLDMPYIQVSEQRDGSLEPPDYVTVNCYPLDSPHIHGYGVPAYDDRTPLELSGFVDLGRHAENSSVFQSLSSTGVMPATSSHTFSPNHGMSRGEFIQLTTNFFGLLGCDGDTIAFDDVLPESGFYAPSMSARSAGLVNGAEGNNLLPNKYVSPADAGTILNRALAYVGLPDQEFTFSRGDYSYILTSYTIRADIAQAFDTLCRLLPLSEAFDGSILLDGAVLDWHARELGGVCYVPVSGLEQLFIAPETREERAEESEESEEKTPEELAAESAETEEPAESKGLEEPESHLPIPLGNTDRVSPCPVTLAGTTVDGMLYRGMPYVALSAAANILPLQVETGADGSLILTVAESSQNVSLNN